MERRSRPIIVVAYAAVIAMALSLVSIIGWGYTLILVSDINKTLETKTNPVRVQTGHLGTKISSHVYHVGERLVPGKGRVQGYAHLHYAQGSEPSKVKTHKINNNGTSKPNKAVKCYSYIAEGAKRKSLDSWYVNPTNNQGLSDAFVLDAVNKAVDQWNSKVKSPIFGDSILDDSAYVDVGGMDGKNVIAFGTIDIEGVIAVTISWGVFDGPIADRVIYEADIIRDQNDYTWCDASLSSNCMDPWNIDTHEIGHALGMGHASDPSCYLNTMAPTASTGETLKRTLYSGDTEGVQGAYGAVLGSPAPPTGASAPLSGRGIFYLQLLVALVLCFSL